MISHIFTTPVARESTGLTMEQLGEIRDYLLELRAASAGEKKSNRGGWHSDGNLFGPDFRDMPEMREAITTALFRYIGDVFSYRGPIQLALTGWTVINGPGHFNVPHNHAANLLSGALYIAVPPGMKDGAITFMDPRLNLNAHETPAMKQLQVRPPWMNTAMDVVPSAGEILIFPSWLNHYVQPFVAEDPKAVRIVVSFNAVVT